MTSTAQPVKASHSLCRTGVLHRTLSLCRGRQITRSWDAHGTARVLVEWQLAPPSMRTAAKELTAAGLVDWIDDRQRTRQYTDLTDLGAATLARWDRILFVDTA